MHTGYAYSKFYSLTYSAFLNFTYIVFCQSHCCKMATFLKRAAVKMKEKSTWIKDFMEAKDLKIKIGTFPR